MLTCVHIIVVLSDHTLPSAQIMTVLSPVMAYPDNESNMEDGKSFAASLRTSITDDTAIPND